MFNEAHIRKYFNASDECVINCINNRLSDAHMRLMAGVDELFCTLEHENTFESAVRIAELSLKYKNIKGVNLDDFNNGATFTAFEPAMLKELRDVVRNINPALKIAAVTYKHNNWQERVSPFIEYIDIFSRWCWVASED
ncbi:MAG: hypothetical protein PHV59_04830, partial [Victivallales bacterium]|nr:hypothetical protein [Victivallales bacterium]